MGKAFRLCTEKDFCTMTPVATVPEMQRCDLTGMVLQVGSKSESGISESIKICFFCWVAPVYGVQAGDLAGVVLQADFGILMG